MRKASPSEITTLSVFKCPKGMVIQQTLIPLKQSNNIPKPGGLH